MGKEPQKPTVLSLFAGIGGFDLGFEQAGFSTVGAVEINPHSQAVLRKRFPEALLWGDVCSYQNQFGPADVVTFGSPCQDLSVAGTRSGLAGERSGLFHEATRVIADMRARYGKPDFVVWENVPGAFSSNRGRDFASVLREVAKLGPLDIGWRVLDALGFGVPQRRRRVFLIADFGGQRTQQVLFEPKGLQGDFGKGKAKRAEATPRFEQGVRVAGFVYRGGRERLLTPHSPTLVTHSPPAVVAFMPNVGTSNITLTPHSPTLRAEDFWSPAVFREGRSIRRLTPTECERLQGFPDGWTAEGLSPDGASYALADGVRYEALGNAVCVPVAQFLAAGIAGAL